MVTIHRLYYSEKYDLIDSIDSLCGISAASNNNNPQVPEDAISRPIDRRSKYGGVESQNRWNSSVQYCSHSQNCSKKEWYMMCVFSLYHDWISFQQNGGVSLL